MRDRLLSARRRGVADLIARWEPDKHPEVLALYGIDAPAVAFDIFLDAIPQPRAKSGRARPPLKPSPTSSAVASGETPRMMPFTSRWWTGPLEWARRRSRRDGL